MKNSICGGKSVRHNKTKSAEKSTKSPIKLKITPRLRRSKRIRENNDGTSARRKQNLVRNPGIAWKPAKSMFSQNQIDYMKMK